MDRMINKAKAVVKTYTKGDSADLGDAIRLLEKEIENTEQMEQNLIYTEKQRAAAIYQIQRTVAQLTNAATDDYYNTHTGYTLRLANAAESVISQLEAFLETTLEESQSPDSPT